MYTNARKRLYSSVLTRPLNQHIYLFKQQSVYNINILIYTYTHHTYIYTYYTMDDEQLPVHWVIRHSKSRNGKIYYFNKKTGESVWQQPKRSQSSTEHARPCETKSSTRNNNNTSVKMPRDGISSNSSEYIFYENK